MKIGFPVVLILAIRFFIHDLEEDALVYESTLPPGLKPLTRRDLMEEYLWEDEGYFYSKMHEACQDDGNTEDRELREQSNTQNNEVN